MENIVTTFEELENIYNLARKAKLEELRFEFVISALFPDVYDNIMNEMKRQHALGYAEGMKDAQDKEVG